MYNRGYSLTETAERIGKRHNRTVSAATISNWLAQHPELTSYQRLRSAVQRAAHLSPPQLIKNIKLYHRQVYEFGYHRGKLALLQEPRRR